MIRIRKQPESYDGSTGKNDLIKWLKWSLKYQREIEKKKDDELTLNIGKAGIRVQINFDFNFTDIILDLEFSPNEKMSGKITCPYTINCKGVDFTRKAYFAEVVFENEVDFSGTIFSENIDINGKITDFSKARFSSIANFYDVTFENETHFTGARFKNEAYFSRAKFSNQANFTKTKFWHNVYFNKARFMNDAYFDEAVFTSDAHFSAATFMNIHFLETKFWHNVYFSKVKFMGDVDFKEVTLEHYTYFNEAQVEGTLRFDNILLGDDAWISLKNINYNTDTQDVAISQEAIKIEIINTIVNARIDFNNVNIKKINLEGSNVMDTGVINRINFEPDCENWATATLFKHEELKRNNIIKALEYKAIEKDLYQIELAPKKYENIQTWAEWASIWLSKKSNNHGQSWVRAVGFTLLTGFIFFLIYSLLRYFDVAVANIFIENLLLQPVQTIFVVLKTAFEDFFVLLATFYIPVNFGEIESYIDNGGKLGLRDFFAIVFYFAGKIFVSYGYVEVVQAFRKLK